MYVSGSRVCFVNTGEDLSSIGCLFDIPATVSVGGANGATTELDMGRNLCRVREGDTFSDEWERPSEKLGWYSGLKSEFPEK